MSVSLSLSLSLIYCLPEIISLEPLVPTSPNFMCLLSMAVARSSKVPEGSALILEITEFPFDTM